VFVALFGNHSVRLSTLALALLVGLLVPRPCRAGAPAGQTRLAEKAAAAVYRECAVGDNIVAIAAIDSMSTIAWRDGFGAKMPHVRLHFDIKRVLYGRLSPDTIVVSDQAAICDNGELLVAEVGEASFWPYVGDVALFCANRLQHDGRDIWHTAHMRVVSGYGGPGARLYTTRSRAHQVHIDCRGGQGKGLNNCVPRTLSDGGPLDEVLRLFAGAP